VGTVLIHLTVLAVLIVFGFSVPPAPESEEGILVNFGTDETGAGLIEPSPPAFQEETSLPLPAESAIAAEEEPVLTQNTEEAPEVKKVDPEAERKRLEQAETEKKRIADLEAERIRKEQEETERKRIEAEQQRQADIMNRTRNALANSKNAQEVREIRDHQPGQLNRRTEEKAAGSAIKEYLMISRDADFRNFLYQNMITRVKARLLWRSVLTDPERLFRQYPG
jgi:outer membrane biosynthesis protein TonB